MIDLLLLDGIVVAAIPKQCRCVIDPRSGMNPIGPWPRSSKSNKKLALELLRRNDTCLRKSILRESQSSARVQTDPKCSALPS